MKHIVLKVIMLVTVLSPIAVVQSALEEKELINITRVKGKNYYHIKFELNKNNFRLNTKFGFNEGGMFELFIPKEIFPISAPKCKKNVILRMPWTDDSIELSARYIKEKKLLYESLININDHKIKVIIELNPYIRVVDAITHKVELTRCNVFFRHSGGRYIPTL